MPKNFLPIRFTGLNLAQHVKEVGDDEFVDMQNVFLTRLGEFKNRSGLRILHAQGIHNKDCLLYTSPSPRDS